MRTMQGKRLRGLFRTLSMSVLAACSHSPTIGDPIVDGGAGSDSGSTSDAGVLDASTSSDGATTADGGTTSVSDAGVDRTGFDKTPCAPNYQPVHGLTPASAVSYVELRRTYKDEMDASASSSPPTVLDASGTKCGGAANATQCTAQFDALPGGGFRVASAGNDIGPSFLQVAYTRGDTAGVLRTTAELGAFLAPVDSANEAALMVTVQGYTLDCTKNSVRTVTGGYEVIVGSGTRCADGNGGPPMEHRFKVATDGTVTLLETVDLGIKQEICGIGRRPDGLVANDGRAFGACTGHPVGDFFADVARLEAASVFAFERLARELEALGAPTSLVLRAVDAARDEVRHARVTSEWAARWGRTAAEPVVDDDRTRTAFDVALENAVEGCVNETFGAALATFQASRAVDPGVRAALRLLAEDETRHAELAWDVLAWFEATLDADSVAKLRGARRRAVDALAVAYANEPAPGLTDHAGLPTAAEAKLLLEGLDEALWSRAA
ncbi:MAG: ferritin-like domain-containing protein [Polyangiaceae bacterium]